MLAACKLARINLLLEKNIHTADSSYVVGR